MKLYMMILIIVVLVSVALMLFSMDKYTESIAAGSTDITFIIIGSLFLIFLFFIFAFMVARVSKH